MTCSQISNQALKKRGYKGLSSGNYGYDDNGTITFDPGRKVNIAPNHMNLPNTITIPDSSGSVVYYYTSDGMLHRQQEIRNGSTVKTRDYLGGVEYVDGNIDQITHEHGYVSINTGNGFAGHLELTGSESSDTTYRSITTVSSRKVPKGRKTNYKTRDTLELREGFSVDPGAEFSAYMTTSPIQGLQYRYFLKDHLGNVRVEFRKNGNSAQVTAVHNYYAFGMEWESTTGSDSRNNYTYNGKETQRSFDLGYSNYGARYYDPAISRFTSVDPLADMYPDISPYVYVLNNPLRYVDPDGRAPVDALGGWPPKWWTRYRESASALKRWPTIMYGREATFTEKAMAEVSAFTSSFGNYTSQNDVTVLSTGRNMDGSPASGVDKAMAGIFVALPVSGGVVKNATGALIEGTIKVFKNGDEVVESAYKFGNLGHAGSKPYREALSAIQGGGNFVAGSKDEALKLLDGALPGIPNQTGKGQGRFGYRIDEGMSGNGLKNGHDGLHINYYDKDSGIKGTILIDQQ